MVNDRGYVCKFPNQNELTRHEVTRVYRLWRVVRIKLTHLRPEWTLVTLELRFTNHIEFVQSSIKMNSHEFETKVYEAQQVCVIVDKNFDTTIYEQNQDLLLHFKDTMTLPKIQAQIPDFQGCLKFKANHWFSIMLHTREDHFFPFLKQLLSCIDEWFVWFNPLHGRSNSYYSVVWYLHCVRFYCITISDRKGL